MYEKYLSKAKSTATMGREVAEKLTDREREYVAIAERNLVAEIDAIDIINSYRFDMMAKYIYAKFYKLRLESDWGFQLYIRHLWAINGYYELDGSGKRGKAAFIDAFNQLLDSVKESGFDASKSIVPLVKGKYLVDGGHRVAACAVYHRPLSILFAEPLDRNYKYIPTDYIFFKERQLPQQFSDAMALEYCRNEDNLYFSILWPSTVGKHPQVERIFQKYGRIAYQKDVFLFNKGPVNLLIQIESGEICTNSGIDPMNLQEKVNVCFKPTGITRVYVFEPDRQEDVVAATTEISALFTDPQHSFYINDNPDTMVHLAELLFNDNSIHFLNYALLDNNSCFSQLLIYYQKWLKERHLDPESVCIADKAVLAAYGIQDCDRLQVLHRGNNEIPDINCEFQSHNAQVHYYGISKDDLIFNPQHFFYYRGLKFTSLKAVKLLKEARLTTQEKADLNRINIFFANPKIRIKKIVFYSQFWLSYWGFYLVQTKVVIFLKKVGRALGRRIPKMLAKLGIVRSDK